MMDQGSGPPVIVIPGIQGRWEWMEPALRALVPTCRIISYSLAGDVGSECEPDRTLGFETYVQQLDRVFDRAGLSRAVLCGVSYGGFIALRYAATRPERVSGLILVSAPAPGWVPSARQQRYLAWPRLSAPLFVLSAPRRVWREIRSAIPSWPDRIRFALVHGARVAAAPLVPTHAAARIAAQQAADFSKDAALVKAPTLVVTGDDDLDRVVPPSVTRRYLASIAGARYEQLQGTGHIGMLTQPDRFARLVSHFVHANHH
ncbi:MAG: alpha/beta hydrolase [Vicinamibacterales bacterium]